MLDGLSRILGDYRDHVPGVRSVATNPGLALLKEAWALPRPRAATLRTAHLPVAGSLDPAPACDSLSMRAKRVVLKAY